jgi:tetratricopeptide (TPR) repeat protein
MTLRLRYQLLLLALIVLGVYYPVLSSGFCPIDDLKRLGSIVNMDSLNFKAVFFRNGGYYYRPIVASSFYLDYLLWGYEASFLHLANILIHLFNSLVVFVITFKLCKRYKSTLSYLPLFAALLFALHPINTEAVSWISGRYDLLATSFVLIACGLLLQKQEKTFKPFSWQLITSLLFFLLGCLSKETAFFFVMGAVWVNFVQARANSERFKTAFSKALPGTVLFSVVGVLYLYFRKIALSGHDSGVNIVVTAAKVGAAKDGVEWIDQLRIMFKVAGFYLKKIFIPYPLNFGIIGMHDAYVVLGFLLLLLCVYCVYRQNLPTALCLASVLVASSALLVVFAEMAWTRIAERYLYMPSFLLVLGIASWLALRQWSPQRVRPFALLGICLIVIFGGMTLQRSFVWSDQVALFEDTVEKSPAFMPAYNDLANLYSTRGEKEKAKKIFEYIAGEVGDRQYSTADINHANLLAQQEKFDEAREILLVRLQNPGKKYNSVARSLIKINYLRISKETNVKVVRDIRLENVELFKEMILRAPDPFLNYQIAKDYLALGEYPSARENFLYAYDHAPSNSHYRAPALKLADAAERNID